MQDKVNFNGEMIKWLHGAENVCSSCGHSNNTQNVISIKMMIKFYYGWRELEGGRVRELTLPYYEIK